MSARPSLRITSQEKKTRWSRHGLLSFGGWVWALCPAEAKLCCPSPPHLPQASSTAHQAPSEWWQKGWIDGKAHRWSTLGKETERCLPFQEVWESSPSWIVPSVLSPPSHPGWKEIGLLPHSDLRLGSICPHKQPPPCLFCQQGLHLGGWTSRQHLLSRDSPRADAQPIPPPTAVRPSLEPGRGSHLGSWRHCLSASAWRKHSI